jgi:hypothetical protein
MTIAMDPDIVRRVSRIGAEPLPRAARARLCLRWTLDAQSGRPIARWVAWPRPDESNRVSVMGHLPSDSGRHAWSAGTLETGFNTSYGPVLSPWAVTCIG